MQGLRPRVRIRAAPSPMLNLAARANVTALLAQPRHAALLPLLRRRPLPPLRPSLPLRPLLPLPCRILPLRVPVQQQQPLAQRGWRGLRGRGPHPPAKGQVVGVVERVGARVGDHQRWDA